MSGLDHPWDLTFLPSKTMLYTQRDRETITWRAPRGASHVVAHQPPGIWHGNETGMEAILVARDFKKTRHFFTCNGAGTDANHEVRVVMWRLSRNARHAYRVRNIVTGLPSTSGRHGGCRLRYGAAALYVSTGDAATGTNPQNLRSGGGKVLRVHANHGRAWGTNPFAHSKYSITRKIFTYGHRNVQGLARRANGQMWSVEQGTYRDDEVNLLRGGGNYGYNPVPGYNESVPMTDHSLPGRQISARWSSGDPTIATCGGIWLRGSRWGPWQNSLAVATLKDSSLRILRFTPKGVFVRMWIPPELNQTYGRLRSVEMGPTNALFITTDNGNGQDRILRVSPR